MIKNATDFYVQLERLLDQADDSLGVSTTLVVALDVLNTLVQEKQDQIRKTSRPMYELEE